MCGWCLLAPYRFCISFCLFSIISHVAPFFLYLLYLSADSGTWHLWHTFEAYLQQTVDLTACPMSAASDKVDAMFLKPGQGRGPNIL